MLRYRTIDVKKDKGELLEFHCRINYESETPYARTISYEQYREKWLTTPQPHDYLSHLAESMRDERTMAEMLDDDGSIAGYLWVTFTDVLDYNITIAEIMDIAVVSDYQQRGVGLEMFNHIEEVARAKGAALLRSDTGIANVASHRLHEKAGFKPYRIHYEKIIG